MRMMLRWTVPVERGNAGPRARTGARNYILSSDSKLCYNSQPLEVLSEKSWFIYLCTELGFERAAGECHGSQARVYSSHLVILAWASPCTLYVSGNCLRH